MASSLARPPASIIKVRRFSALTGNRGDRAAGLSYTQMHAQSKAESVYVAELDVHFPELKLGQTLAFAAGARTKSNTSESAREASQWIASTFGLQDAFDTKVGNDMIRGISGGEKKRVSIAEGFMSGARVQCWDNSTRGLDSSTALDFVTTLRTVADSLASTVLVSVYQASEAIYNVSSTILLPSHPSSG